MIEKRNYHKYSLIILSFIMILKKNNKQLVLEMRIRLPLSIIKYVYKNIFQFMNFGEKYEEK